MTYWLITFNLSTVCQSMSDEERSELEFSLIEAGAEGLYSTSSESLHCFLSSLNEQDAITFAKSQISDQLLSFEVTSVPEENWTQRSNELLQPIHIGTLQIIPVTDSTAAYKIQQTLTEEEIKNKLFIIPGMGFGTGHHATTKTVLTFLDEACKKFNQKSVILDFGTGSGILAIAAAKLLPQSRITAVDNDSAAIDNAIENAAMNKVPQISFCVEALPLHHADIILANIYAELLQEFASDFYTHLSSSGILIISGIMQEKAQLIDSSFPPKKWELLKDKNEQGWVSRMYKKKE